MSIKPPSLVRAVDEAFRAAKPEPRDRAAVVLVKRYAALIDDAAAVAAELDALRADLDPEDVSARKVLEALRARVDAQAVASDLGPKFLASLTALGMTVQGRVAAAPKGGAQGGGKPGPTSVLDELRARRGRSG